MRDFPSCFSESGVQVADSSSSSSSSSNSSKASQNLVTCVYQSQFQGNSCFITITWSKCLMGQGVSIGIQSSTDQCLCKVDIKPWWLLTRRKGFRSSEVNSTAIHIYWDFSSAKFGPGPEPLEGFYLAVAFDQELVLLLGDLHKQVYEKIDASHIASNTVFVAKKEHIFGKKSFDAKAQLCNKGRIHEIAIECDPGGTNDPSLSIRVDDNVALQVKRLRWKFRGNHSISVDGLPVEVCWDVHNWFFGNAMGNAVFLFQTSLSAAEKLQNTQHSNVYSNLSVFNPSGSHIFENSHSQDQGFALILYAWRNE